MVLLFTPHHAQLISDCYPPSAALLTSAPEYKPNSQELSRLTYYASNKPGKIAKLSSVLQKRVLTDVRKAKTGNLRARAALLISLNIWRALVSECRQNISLLSSALLSSLDTCLSELTNDLEVSAKLATVFTAWATYSSGQLLGVDASLTRDYVSTLRHFSVMSIRDTRKDDVEERNRFRLIGLAALAGAVASETLYNSSTQFKAQVSTIVPPLITNLLTFSIEILEEEAQNIRNHPHPVSQYVTDARSRPVIERRAASIHVHITGDSGPTNKDVANATLRAFSALLGQSNAGQIGLVLLSTFDTISTQKRWGSADLCCWLASRAIEWIQYQYRFAVPVRLIERLSEAQDDETLTTLHTTLAAMIKTVFVSPIPLVNLSTSDVLSSLTSLILHRISVSTNDNLLPVLVECIGALGTHIYYADQVHDLACELVSRIISIESIGVTGRGRVYTRKEDERAMALRCLSTALSYLIETSAKYLHNSSKAGDSSEEKDGDNNTHSTNSPQMNGDMSTPQLVLPHRTKITPDVLQETLALLCDERFEVRSDYVRALVTFLRTEVSPERPPLGDGKESNGSQRRRASLDTSVQHHRSVRMSMAFGGGVGATNQFLHALYASLFMLATSPRLGLPSTTFPSPSHSVDEIDNTLQPIQVNIIPSTPMRNETASGPDESIQDTSRSQASQSSSRRKGSTGRKLAKLRRLLEQANRRHSVSGPEASSCAMLSDYSHILSILVLLQEQLPSRSLLLGVPMLLALQNWCQTVCSAQKESSEEALPRQKAIFELLAKTWLRIAEIWECLELQTMAAKVLSSSSPIIPDTCSTERFPQSTAAQPLGPVPRETEFPRVDAEVATSLLSSHQPVQVATGLDAETLLTRLRSSWTPEKSLNDSFSQSRGGDPSSPAISNPVLRIAPGLMHIENLSLQSLNRSNRGVGVNELREVLEGRANMSNIVLSQQRPPSISSFGAHTFAATSDSHHDRSQMFKESRAKSRAPNGEGPSEVRDVLDKLGIGSKGGPSLFKASLAAKQKQKELALSDEAQKS